MKSVNEKYFVYVYLDPREEGVFKIGEHIFDCKPFYVGKGSKYRHRTHLNDVIRKRNKNNHRSNVIKNILDCGKEPIILRIKFFREESDAYAYEKVIYDYCINSDIKLTNYKECGRGGTFSPEIIKEKFIGRKITEEAKHKMRLAKLGKKHSEETKMLMSIQRKGKPQNHKPPTEETKMKISRALKGRKRSEEFGKMLSEKRKQMIADAEDKYTLIPNNKGRKHTSKIFLD